LFFPAEEICRHHNANVIMVLSQDDVSITVVIFTILILILITPPLHFWPPLLTLTWYMRPVSLVWIS
jgi:hypothetical protein